MTDKLFTPLVLGPITLRHRVVMAPLTRMRASPDGNVPTALNAEYYAQRAKVRHQTAILSVFRPPSLKESST
ncbi:MAG: hypothetical protein JNL87_11705 [Burkholderiaceae bacterium]|nr:hypothetical protein [Burkholderiaceae bacterium]